MTLYFLWTVEMALAAGILIWITLFELPKTNLDRTRDRLFDFAFDRKLDFESDAYKITRETLNGMIYYSQLPNNFNI